MVHWEVSSSLSDFEDQVFTACGRHGSISMRDPSWQHALESDRPISCPHCKALLKAASDAP
jgi:hypothetical protein